MPDEVLMNMPIGMGYWPNGVSAPQVIGHNYAIDTSTVTADNCNLPTVRYTMSTCEMVAPNMREIGLETSDLNVMELTEDFCRRRNILRNQLCIFDQNGNFAPGQPFAMNFATWAMQVTYEAWAQIVARSALKGDDANVNEFDGLYTQLTGGWLQSPSSAQPCPSGQNTEQVIDWGDLTGTPGVPAQPDAVTVAGKTINLWGSNITIPAGYNLAQFLERFWFDTVEWNWTAFRGGVTQWEAHSRFGFQRCLAELSACMQPCKDCPPSVISDPDLRVRFANAVNNKLIKFYPSGRVLPVFETNYMPANTLRIGPRSVGGRPTYKLFWDNIDRYFAILNGVDYGGAYGVPPEETMMIDADYTKLNFEQMTIRWDFIRKTQKCLRGSLLSKLGMLVCSRHLWLRIDNVTCDTTIAFPVCEPNITVDGVKLT
jgi:hypothetical protein